jgi:phosphatidylserine/phosphatidylglycerophosphate/cardiolipin synthase-like enzyme
VRRMDHVVKRVTQVLRPVSHAMGPKNQTIRQVGKAIGRENQALRRVTQAMNRENPAARRESESGVAAFIALIPLLLLFAVVSSCLDGCLHPAASSSPATQIEEFELVESIPVETNLDNADIRNTHEVWLEMISGATSTLELEEFYVSDAPGEPLEDILGAIVDAAQRSVRVRFIVDSRMYRTYPERLDWLSKQKNTEVRTIDMASISGGVMHAKYFVVDGKQIFLGSQNFDWRALKHIHEIGCRVRSERLARIFSDLFELDWKLAERSGKKPLGSGLAGTRSAGSRGQVEIARMAGKQFRIHEHYRVPLTGVVDVPYPHGTLPPKYGSKDSIEIWPVYSPRGFIPDESLWDEQKIVKLIDSARHEVDIQVLTYSTISENNYYPELDTALRSAAARGVLVKLIVSDWAKAHPKIDCLKSLSVIPNIQVKLSTIPMWSGGFVPYARVEHCKYMVVDGKMSWIGTSNWEKEYFRNSRNVGIVVRSAAMAEMLREIFYKDWDGEYTYTIRPEEEYSPPKRAE